MSQKISSENYVVTVPLVVDAATARELAIRFELARQVYNACLGECLRRVRLVKESKAWRQAARMPPGRERNEALKAARERWGCTGEYMLDSFSRQFTAAGFSKRIGAGIQIALAHRAYETVRKAWFPTPSERRLHKTGKRPKPRFKRFRELVSVTGRNNKDALRWTAAGLCWLKLIIPGDENSYDDVIRYGLGQQVRQTRLVRRFIRGKDRYYAQLVVRGTPPKKPHVHAGLGIVGVDLGPSTVAVVSEAGCFLTTFCAELDRRERLVRTLMRRLDRQRRANNPDNYAADGAVKKGPKKWSKSARQRATELKLKSLAAQQAEHRKNLHGQLVSRIIQLGNTVLLETNSYRGWQKQFGRSVSFRAPGMFVARLKQACEKYGVRFAEINTPRTRLSQTCHCGRIRKKKLSERTHKCPCGVECQRDLYSAFLARFVINGDTLDVARASQAWEGLCNALRAASEGFNGCKSLTGLAPRKRRRWRPSHAIPRKA